MVLTLSADGSMRRWYWNGVEPKARNLDKYHILGPGETINTLAKRYGTEVAAIIKWNKIKDTKKLYIGQRLCVRKSDTGEGSELNKNIKKKNKRASRAATATTASSKK